jgi:cytochrome c oxidase subunit 1
MFVGFNITFFPMHFTGLLGMPRRVYTYTAALGVTDLNLVSTIGAFILFTSVAMFTWNIITTLHHGQRAPWDPWDGATLEWATSSPPPTFNFSARYPVPPVHSYAPLLDLREKEEQHARSGAG